MAKFRVRFVDDDQLPDETEWAVARCADGEQLLFVKRRACAGECGPCSILAEARRALGYSSSSSRPAATNA